MVSQAAWSKYHASCLKDPCSEHDSEHYDQQHALAIQPRNFREHINRLTIDKYEIDLHCLGRMGDREFWDEEQRG